MPRKRIFLVAAEIAPFAKTGGLADAISALPRALAERGHDVRIAMPLYACVDREAWNLRLVLPEVSVFFPGRLYHGKVYEGRLPGMPDNLEVPVYFIDNPAFFERPGLYGEDGEDYPDNALRYGFFCSAALWMLKGLNWAPDIIHCNDWQTGMIPAFCKTSPSFRDDPFFANTRFLYAIHNLGYLGSFHPAVLPVLGLPPSDNDLNRLEFFGGICFMKAGILYSDRVCTVSRRYAEEILTREFGCGLEGWMLYHGIKPSGILNGIDDAEWNPAHDPLIAAHYSVADMTGKAGCKAALEKTLRWTEEPNTPLIAMITRLDSQKGVDIFIESLPAIFQLGARVALLGSGAPEYHEQLEKLHKLHPKQMRLRLAFDPKLAHAMEAGADMFLMPSRYEPCGLNQMYSMRYGTVPIVRNTGGLADTVTHSTPPAIANGLATGFVFDDYTAEALTEAVEQALHIYRQRPEIWEQIKHNGMRQDFSWARSAAEYEKLYREMLGGV